MENEIVDPDNEYIKICAYEYCKKVFEADHMLQCYCPEKNGVRNFCKNRQKRLNDQKKKEEKEMEAKTIEVAPTPPVIVSEPAVLPKDPIMDAYKQKAAQRDLTIKFIISRIEAYKFIDVPLITIEAFGIDLTAFDHKQFLPAQKRHMLVFGTYGAIWIEDHLIRFTNLI